VPNGPIAKFQFNHPNSVAVVTEQSQGYQADVDWAKYCTYAGVQVYQETGKVVVFNPSLGRSRSTSNPVVVQPKPHRIERAVSHPPRPEVDQRKRLDSGYSSEQSIRSWQSGNTWFAEV
jgi:hypothetical protein